MRREDAALAERIEEFWAASGYLRDPIAYTRRMTDILWPAPPQAQLDLSIFRKDTPNAPR